MLVKDLLNIDKLKEYKDSGYISVRKHPTLPLRIFNYTANAQFDQFWPHEVCQCRGLILDDSDVVVARSQYKFFNLGQTSTIIMPTTFNVPGFMVDENVMVDSEYIANLVRLTRKPMTITRKMDGMMGVLWNYGDQWGIATRGSFESEGAAFATQKFQKFVKYGAVEFIPKGWTLIFEIIAKHLRIVVPYEWEGLCLLTAVNNKTGEEMDYEDLHALWLKLNSYSDHLTTGKTWCRMVGRFDIDIAAAQVDPSMVDEGYVVSANRPGMPPVKVKIKLAEYKRLHKILTGVTPQMIWSELSDPMSPWLTVDTKYDRKTKETTHTMAVPHEFAQWVKQWQRGLTGAFHANLMLAVEASGKLFHRENTTCDCAKYGCGGNGSDQPLYLPNGKEQYELRHDADRKAWLEFYGGVVKELTTPALLIYNGRIVEAYEALWKTVRPFGREDKFYVEGKGE